MSHQLIDLSDIFGNHVGEDGVPQFDLDLQKSPLRLRDPETKEMKKYAIVEIDGRERDKYLNMIGNRQKYDQRGNAIGLRNFDGIHAKLVAAHLWEAEWEEVDGEIDPETIKPVKQVPEGIVQKWPSSVQTALFKASQRISGLDDKGEEQAKND